MRALRVIKQSMDARTAKADLNYPVLSYGSGRNRIILDGSHRIRKARATGDPLREVSVPEEILLQAIADKEEDQKQYSPVNGKMIDIEKLWELTKDLKSAPIVWPEWSNKRS